MTRQTTAQPDLRLATPTSHRVPSRSKLAINEVTTYRWSLDEDVEGYLQAGVEAIGVWRPKLVRFGEERGIDLLGESGLKVSSLSWAGGFTGSNGHSFVDAVDDTINTISTAAALQADCVVIVSGARAGHTTNHARELLVDALREAGDFAGELGLELAIQPMHTLFASEWSFLTNLDDTLDILSRCNHPALKIAFDVYHLWQEPRLVERLPEIASHCATVRLSDWRSPPRSDSDRCLPGDGCIPLREIVRAFLAAEYGGFFELEIWSEELWGSDYAQLLDLCQTRFDELIAP